MNRVNEHDPKVWSPFVQDREVGIGQLKNPCPCQADRKWPVHSLIFSCPKHSPDCLNPLQLYPRISIFRFRM